MRNIKMRKKMGVGVCAGMLAAAMCLAADGSWLKKVPEADRARVNPVAGQEEAIAGGKRVFEDHCAKCHGPDALGRGKRPSLRSERIQNAKDGEIFWLLKNGNLGKGMPTWAALPEPMRWQIIAYVKSLGVASDGEAEKSTDGVK
jgi:mono/diheme cytochrome c family protein